jgi:hypothetical protein
MARKRSLKDAAADQLVEKNTALSRPPTAPAESRDAAPEEWKAVHAEPAATGPAVPCAPPAAAKPCDGRTSSCPALLWRAILVGIGFAAGFFFGVGQGLGPAHMVYLVTGTAGGFFLGRFFTIR